ncbi:MAG: endolytic transglycosylase MltG [Candidatus Hydrogenedentes bacterium]|nr:endolytic transglycosylase MltG [Candidatus Hydrogenedentota bacterium]
MTANPPHEQAPSPKRKRRWLARLAGLFFLVLLLLVVAGAFLAYMVYDHVTRPGVSGSVSRVVVPEGAKGKDIGRILTTEGYIEHPSFFWLAIRIDGSNRPIKYGPYSLPHGLSALELLRLMQKGPNAPLLPGEIPDDRRVTVPEGLALSQIAQMFPDPRAFLNAAADQALIARLGIHAQTLEGFLMPNTYFFEKKPTEREVVARMVEQFEKAYASLLTEFPEAAARNKMEVVTIASLVEKEAKLDAERPLVAAVIYNRLRQGIPLSLDSTLQYALSKYGQRMMDADKQVDSQYNTYKNAGLPPGPVGNPGMAGLRAALNPAKEDYLYFVSNADGQTHTFSKTLAEHERAVADYRAKMKVQRAEQKAHEQAAAN